MLIVTFFNEGLEDFEIIGKAGKIIRLVKVKMIFYHYILSYLISYMQVMRILRIYKLVRHFAGLQSLFYTLQQASLYYNNMQTNYLFDLVGWVTSSFVTLGPILSSSFLHNPFIMLRCQQMVSKATAFYGKLKVQEAISQRKHETYKLHFRCHSLS